MKEEMAARAQLIINDIMPAKILQLNKLFQVCILKFIIGGI